MDKKLLEEILEYTKKGATLEMIAKHKGISTRTLQRYLQPYREEIKIARAYYQSFIEGMFS